MGILVSRLAVASCIVAPDGLTPNVEDIRWREGGNEFEAPAIKNPEAKSEHEDPIHNTNKTILDGGWDMWELRNDALHLTESRIALGTVWEGKVHAHGPRIRPRSAMRDAKQERKFALFYTKYFF
jgi:hypothetical protein